MVIICSTIRFLHKICAHNKNKKLLQEYTDHDKILIDTCTMKNYDIINLLIDYGANIYIKKYGNTYRHIHQYQWIFMKKMKVY